MKFVYVTPGLRMALNRSSDEEQEKIIFCGQPSYGFVNNKTKITRIKKTDKRNIKVVIEQVSAMPGQGVTSMFNFGQSFGILKGICSAMRLSMYFVRPAKWKKYFNLINSEKDASRARAIEIFPYFSSQLSRKKDSNKADAILIASFYYETYKLED